MEKEFEALNYLYNDLRLMKCLNVAEEAKVKSAYECLEQALTELKQIKEAKPSEALKYVDGKIADLEDDLQHYTMVDKDKCRELYIREDLKQFTNIQQALQKAQEQEKVLELLKPLCEVVETPVKKFRYLKINGVVVYTFKTEEEFDLLKRYFNEQDN